MMNKKCEKILHWFYLQKKRNYVPTAEIEQRLGRPPEKSDAFLLLEKQKYIKIARRIDVAKLAQDAAYVPEAKGYAITDKGKIYIENAEMKKQSWGGLIASYFKR